MAVTQLTPKQRRLRAEIEELSTFVQMDHWNIQDYPEDGRTSYLEIMKRQLVRGHVITKYTLIDEFLSCLICHYYFRKPGKGMSYRQLWRTKKFRVLNHYILDETFLLQKMRTVHAIREFPTRIRDAIERINALRNAVAHSFFPENRRQYANYKKVMYRGTDIYSKAGVEKFMEDFGAISEYLFERLGWS